MTEEKEAVEDRRPVYRPTSHPSAIGIGAWLMGL